MRAQQAPFEGRTAPRADDVDGDAGCVGADDCIGRRDGLQFRHQLLFGTGPLDDGLDNPVALRDCRLQIVLYVAQVISPARSRLKRLAGRACVMRSNPA